MMPMFLTVCDYLGERLASLFGITTPKYQYAIDEYYRIKKEVGGLVHQLTRLHFRLESPACTEVEHTRCLQRGTGNKTNTIL